MELLLLLRGKIDGVRQRGRSSKLLPFFIALVMLTSCRGISISIEDSTDDVSKAKRREIMNKMKHLQEYNIVTDGYKLLIADSVYYPYPILRDKLKLVALKDDIVKHRYEVEISPMYNGRLQNYSVLEFYQDSLIVVGFTDNKGDLYIDMVNLKRLKLLSSLKCKNDSNGKLLITALEIIHDSLFVIGTSSRNRTYINTIKVLRDGQCQVSNKLLVDSFFEGPYMPFYVADFYQSNDTINAVVYIQSSGWDSNYIAVVRLSAYDKIYEVKSYVDRLIPFSTVENMNNLNAGRLALINNRVAVADSEYVVLHPFKPVYYDSFGNIDTLEKFVNESLYAFQDSVLNSKFDAYTCRSGTIVNIPEFENTKSKHGFIIQNKVIKGTKNWGTTIYIKDTATNTGFASIFLQVLKNGSIRKYRTASVISILDGLRLVGKIGGSPFSKEEINSMKVDLGSPSELLSAVGYAGFGGCYFVSADSLLCIAYISEKIPYLSQGNTIVSMGDIPYSELSQIGKTEEIDVRMIIGIWSIID